MQRTLAASSFLGSLAEHFSSKEIQRSILFLSTPARRQNQRNSFSLAKLPICKKRSADGALSIVLPPKGKPLLAARKLLSGNNLTA